MKQQHTGVNKCGDCDNAALTSCCVCYKRLCNLHAYVVNGFAYCDVHRPNTLVPLEPEEVPVRGLSLKLSSWSSALIALVVTIVGLFSYQTSAYAQAPEVELITDPEIVKMIMEGKTPDMTIASTDAIDQFWMRTLWDIEDTEEVWVALTSEPSNTVDLLTYTNGIYAAQQLFTDANFQQWEFPRTLAKTTHSITALGNHGWVNTQLDWRDCGESEEGPTFSIVQTEDTWLAIGNRTNESFWFIALGQEWRELLPGETIGFRIHSLGYGDVVVRRYTPGPDCGMLAWDFDGESTPIPPWPFESRSLHVSMSTDLIVDTSSVFTVPMTLTGVKGDKRAISGNLHYSDTLRFVGMSILGTTLEPFIENFRYYDRGGYVEFSGFSSTTSIVQDGVAVNSVFRSTYYEADAGLVVRDFVFGPEESEAEIQNGHVEIRELYTVSGYVESFTGYRDIETGFVHDSPSGHQNNYVSESDASFSVTNALPGNHTLFFYSMNSDADFASIGITDVTWTHLCELEMLSEQDCEIMSMDAKNDEMLDIYDVLFCSSFVLNLVENDSRAGWHEYEPYPLEYLPLARDEQIVIKSAVVCDPNGSRWYASSASADQIASATFGQENGEYHITVFGNQFYGALVELDLHGGRIASARLGDKDLSFNEEGKIIGLSNSAVDAMTIHFTVEDTQNVSVIKAEVNGWLPPTIPQQASTVIYLPIAAR